MMERLCVIAGVGPGNGVAIARKFAAEGYAVALIARDAARLDEYTRGIKTAHAYTCDLTQPASVTETFARIRRDLGPVDTLVYNAGNAKWGTVEEILPADFEHGWRTNALGLLVTAQAVLPDMRAAGRGNIVVIGATAALRGGANFAAFAPAKAAQRSLTQSLARHLGPAGIHVAYVVIDGVVDLPPARAMLPDKPDEFFLQPDHIAESVYFLTRQPRSAWTFELDLRPFGERW